MTFTGRGLTEGHFHLAVTGRHIGTLRITVRAQPTARFPPCLPDVVVSTLRVTAAATSVRGVTPRSRVPGAYTRHHSSTHVRGPGARPRGIATPQSPPSRQTLTLLTGRIYPFDFHRTGFGRGTFPPGCDRPAHRYTSDQGPGPTHRKIPYVSTRRGHFHPLCDGDRDVREGGHATEPRAGCLHPPPHFGTCERAQRKTSRHSYPPKVPRPIKPFHS